MNTLISIIDWAAVLGVAGGVGVMAFMLLLIARMQSRQRGSRVRSRPHQWAMR